jgi:hypothetical protein
MSGAVQSTAYERLVGSIASGSVQRLLARLNKRSHAATLRPVIAVSSHFNRLCAGGATMAESARTNHRLFVSAAAATTTTLTLVPQVLVTDVGPSARLARRDPSKVSSG